MTAQKPFRPTPTQQRALDLMRTRHDGSVHSGEGFSVTTLDALAREGLCTVERSNRADGVLRRTRFPYFEATLTDEGWEGHERPAEPGPAYGEPTSVNELREGDRVINVHTGSEGTWGGLNGLGSYSVDTVGATYHTGDGNWRLLERAPEAKGVPAPAEGLGTSQGSEARRSATDGRGRRFAVGQRVTWRSSDGFLFTGTVRAFTTDSHGGALLTFDADTRTLAPPRRPAFGAPSRTARSTPISPPELWTVALDAHVAPA